MKSFSNLLLSLILVAFSGTVLAGENVYKATDNEELFGKWVNMEYTTGTPPQMANFKLGENEYYSSVDDKESMFTAEFIISHKWTDSKGNIWYRAKWNAGMMGSGFSLIKLSESGNTFESNFSQWEHPKEIDINNEYYRLYYRK